MKKVIFILCVILVVLLIVWLVMRYNKFIAPSEKYVASDADTEIVIYDIDDLEQRAANVIPSAGFDYIYGGAETERTMHKNISAFDEIEIYPRVLTGVDAPDISTSILGVDISLPVIAAPAAAHGLAHVSAEAGSARGVAASGTIMSVSNYASSSLEEIADAVPGAPQWFQLYLSKDDSFNRALVKKAEDLGFRAIILTVDAPIGGRRVRDIRNDFKFPLPLPNVAQKSGPTKGQGIGKIFAAAQNRFAFDTVQYVKSLTADCDYDTILAKVSQVGVACHNGVASAVAPCVCGYVVFFLVCHFLWCESFGREESHEVCLVAEGYAAVEGKCEVVAHAESGAVVVASVGEVVGCGASECYGACYEVVAETVGVGMSLGIDSCSETYGFGYDGVFAGFLHSVFAVVVDVFEELVESEVDVPVVGAFEFFVGYTSYDVEFAYCGVLV